MDLATAASVVSAAAILFGLVFAGWQLRALGQQRAHEAQLQLIQSFQTADFARAVAYLIELPDGLSYAEIKARMGDEAFLFLEFAFALEGIGVLVARRELSLQLVEATYSGPYIIGWRKLRRYVEDMRAMTGTQTPLEYFQWTAERLADRRAITPPEPAYLALKDWKA
jgi:hypothetical protein